MTNQGKEITSYDLYYNTTEDTPLKIALKLSSDPRPRLIAVNSSIHFLAITAVLQNSGKAYYFEDEHIIGTTSNLPNNEGSELTVTTTNHDIVEITWESLQDGAKAADTVRKGESLKILVEQEELVRTLDRISDADTIKEVKNGDDFLWQMGLEVIRKFGEQSLLIVLLAILIFWALSRMSCRYKRTPKTWEFEFNPR